MNIDHNLEEANDEFEGVNRKIEESKQKLDNIVSGNAEQEDIEAHRNNIILYGVVETSQIRAEERMKEDIDFCEKFLVALQVGVVPEDMIKVLRLGKRNTVGASPRPILIQLSTRHVRNLVTESLCKIKSVEAKFQGVIVSHDMTKKQREECKALVAEVKSKSESGGLGLQGPGHTRALETNTNKKKKLIASVEVLYRNNKNKSKRIYRIPCLIHIKNFWFCTQTLIRYTTK